MNIKKIVLFCIFLGVFMSFSTARAATSSQIQMQIDSLLKLITQLQEQLKETNDSNDVEKSCHTSALWSWNYATSNCKGDAGEGDCDKDADCNTGYCALNVGEKYGQNKIMDVCEEKETTTCTNTDWFGSGDENHKKRLSIKGTCVDSSGTNTDVCMDDNMLRDYTCEPLLQDPKSCGYTTYSCKTYGFTGCSNGACIKEETTIPDNTCGDGKCSSEETFSTCPMDCGYEVKPYDSDVASCTNSRGIKYPTSGEGAADWFVWNGCSKEKYYEVNQEERLFFRARTDKYMCWHPNFFLYEYENETWKYKKYFNLTDKMTNEEYVSYIPTSNKIKITAYQCFYLYTYTATPVKPVIQEKSITITSPNGGEKWTSVDKVTDTISGNESFLKYITWTGGSDPDSSDSYSSVDAYLEQLINGQYVKTGRILSFGYDSIAWVVGVVSDSNCTYPDGVGNNPIPSDYCWLKTNMKVVPSGQYYVHLIDRTTKAEDRSDASFNIVAAKSIGVTSPNGGEQWVAGETYNITWTSTGVENVHIDIVHYGTTSSSYSLISNIPASQRSWSWTIGSKWPDLPVSDKYKIRVFTYPLPASGTWQEGVNYDKSDSYFTIAEAVTACTDSDDGSKPYVKGTVTGRLGGEGDISTYTDFCSDKNWNPIDSCGKEGCYQMEYVCSSDGKAAKVASYCAYGCSDGACLEEKSITVTSPNGGEQWVEGQTYNIAWETQGINQVGIELQDYTTSFYAGIVSKIDATQKSYSWKIPDNFFSLTYGLEPGDDYKIRIFEQELDGTRGLEDESNNYLSIITSNLGLQNIEDQLASISEIVNGLLEKFIK